MEKRDYTHIFLADREEYQVKSYEEFWNNGHRYFKAKLRITPAGQPGGYLEGPLSSILFARYEVYEEADEALHDQP